MSKHYNPEILDSEPNYEIACTVCGEKPTVDLIIPDTKLLFERTRMCGVCMFGEADAIDPENW
jgi:hypothetical protein